MKHLKLLLPDDLHREIKSRAALSRMTIGGYVVKVLEQEHRQIKIDLTPNN